MRSASPSSPTPIDGTLSSGRPADSFDGLLAAWNREEGLTAKPFEFTDPLTIAETRARIADVQRDSDRPGTVIVGSVENGQWVNWNQAVPRPPIPSY